MEKNEINQVTVETSKGKSKAGKVILSILLFVVFSAAYFGIMILAWNRYYEGYSILIFDPLIFLPLLTIAVAAIETLVARKLKIPQFVLMATSFWPIIVLIISLFTVAIDNQWIIALNDNISMLIGYLAIFAVRLFVAVIDNFVHKKRLVAVLLIVAMLVSGGSGIAAIFSDNEIAEAVLKIRSGGGEPDRTSSWGSINQPVNRAKDWQQIVENSQFQLGEMKTSNQDEFCDYVAEWNTYPHLDGSTVCVPMAVEFARQHLGFDDKTSNRFTQFSTTHYAYENLIYRNMSYDFSYWNSDEKYIGIKPNKAVDMVIGTEPSDDELAMAKRAGIELVKKPVCYDAFVFITHKNNPVESLTVEQIKDIYSGKITNWKDVGGKDEKIVAYQREANSGSQTAMVNLVMGGKNMIDPVTIKVVEGMGGLIDYVAEYKNKTASIGYTYKYYIDALYKNDNIKTIAINGIAPNDENIKSGKYPYSTNYYGVIRHGDEDKVGGKFLDWILSDEGQKCVKQAGYITVK